MKIVKDFLWSMLSWFVMAVLISAIIYFVGVKLLVFDFTYRIVFWSLFAVAVSWELWMISFIPWSRIYFKHLRRGTSEEFAFTCACDSTRPCPPRWLLKRMLVILHVAVYQCYLKQSYY